MSETGEPPRERWSQAVRRVLNGDESYDALSDAEQATVRAEWDRRIKERKESLDLEAMFIAEGRMWVEGDEHGNVIYKGVDEDGQVVDLSRDDWERRG